MTINQPDKTVSKIAQETAREIYDAACTVEMDCSVGDIERIIQKHFANSEAQTPPKPETIGLSRTETEKVLKIVRARLAVDEACGSESETLHEFEYLIAEIDRLNALVSAVWQSAAEQLEKKDNEIAQLKSDLQQEISARNGWWDNCKKAEQERESMQRQLGEKDRVLAQNEKVIEKLRMIADALKGDTADEVVAITNSLFDTEAERDSLQAQVDGLTSWMENVKLAAQEGGSANVILQGVINALDESPAASLQAHDAKLQLERDALAKALQAAYDTMGLPPGCTIEPSIEKAIEDYKVSLTALKAEWRERVTEEAADHIAKRLISPCKESCCSAGNQRIESAVHELHLLAADPKRKEGGE